MYFSFLDLGIILVIFIFISFGFVAGLLSAIGSLVGIVVGTWAAGAFYGEVANWLTPIFLGNQATASIVAFILVFTLVNRGIGLIFWLLNKLFGIISLIPFTKSLNRILGAILGFIEGVLATGVILYFISHLPIAGDFLNNAIATSPIAQLVIWVAGILVPLLPEILRQVSPL